MSNEVNDLGDLILAMLDQGSSTFKQCDVVQELLLEDGTAKVHFSIALRITKAELPDGEVIELCN